MKCRKTSSRTPLRCPNAPSAHTVDPRFLCATSAPRRRCTSRWDLSILLPQTMRPPGRRTNRGRIYGRVVEHGGCRLRRKRREPGGSNMKRMMQNLWSCVKSGKKSRGCYSVQARLWCNESRIDAPWPDLQPRRPRRLQYTRREFPIRLL